MLLEVYINFFESFVLFFIKKLMFLSFPLLFFQQNANQSETRIGDEKLSVELCMVTHLLFHENFSFICAIELSSSIFITL